MTDQYLRNTTPDYISGAVSACSGIQNSIVLINGPLGCKFYYGFAAGQSYIDRSDLWNLRGELSIKGSMPDRLLRSQYYAGSVNIPATNLRYEDFIFGTAEQLKRALSDILSERNCSVLFVIQAPGTSLLSESLEKDIEDVCSQTDTPYIYIEAPELSEDFDTGYDETVVRILRKFSDRSDPENSYNNTGRPCVNIFGLHNYQRYLEGDIEELTRILDLCGADVRCIMSAGCMLNDVIESQRADANIFLTSERCFRTAEYLKTCQYIHNIDIGFIPVGPDLTENFIRTVCKALDTDSSKAIEDTERTRAKIFYHLAKRTGGREFPGNLRFSAEGEPSVIYAFTDYLSGYLGIPPAALNVLYEKCPGRGHDLLNGLLKEIGFDAAVSKNIKKENNVLLLGSANTIADVMLTNSNIFGIETACPPSGYIDVVPKTYAGNRGALFLLEQVLNGSRLLNAWNQ